MNVRKIVENWLIKHGYDGLWSGDECGCQIGDLFPCNSEGIENCHPGYLAKCTAPACEAHTYCHGHIQPGKPA